MRKLITATTVGMLVWSAAPAVFGQEDKFVSKEEYQKLQRKYEALDKEMEEFRAWKKQMQEPPPVGDKAVAEKGSLSTGQMASYVFPGTSRSLLTGYGAVNLNFEENSDSGFRVQFNPIWLYKISDKLLFEAEVEFELEESEFKTALELAHLSYVINDYLTFDAGDFLAPNNAYDDKFHPAWLRRLPNHPLAVHEARLLPETYLGAQLRGAAPIGPTKINYAVLVGNAPTFDSGSGRLEFENAETGSFATGGRIGIFVLPELEIGYGMHYSGVAGSDGANAWIHSMDLNYVRSSDALRGTARLSAQYIWSDVDDEAGFNDNFRHGGYGQIAYRPDKLECPILKDLEMVFRYDRLDESKPLGNSAPGSEQQRFALGLNYWLGPTTVLKAAIQKVDIKNTSDDSDGIFLQFATGF